MKQLSPCLALEFLREADVWLQDFGTQDIKTTEERAELQTCTLNPKYICLMGVWDIQEFQQNAC